MDTKRIIKKVAVLGPGGMGSLIACHFANAGLQVLLLDKAGTDGDARSRNKPVNDALTAALKSSPPPLYARSFARNITTGNFEDDLNQVTGCDWVLEAVSEGTDATQKLLAEVEQFRKPGTLITSATSDIPLHLITDGRSEDFRRHFCRTLFSGPPRYTQLLEITPTADTLPEVIDFLMYYGEKYLGKTTVLAGDLRGIMPSKREKIVLDNIRASNTLWKNSSTTITDIGDGIINLEFHSKMNTIGSEVLEGINQAISIAEQHYRGLVICNSGENFSAGPDLNLIATLITNNQFDALDALIKEFQHTMMRIRYSGIPVVAAPHQKALGAGCELCLHANKVVAHAELYMGLVEFGLGLIPAGGGTKELVLRLGDELQDGDIEVNNFRARFLTIGQAKVSTSAYEAFELGYLKKARDVVVMSGNHLLTEAKRHCLLLADGGYVQPVPRKDIRVLGKLALGIGYQTAGSMYAGNYISGHDLKVAQKLAYVMAGADLSQPTLVSEGYLLDLERETFISLCAEKKTQERIQSFLTGGKIVRN